MTNEEQADRYYLDLKRARERLCRAQTFAPLCDVEFLQGAIDRIDLALVTCPEELRL